MVPGSVRCSPLQPVEEYPLRKHILHEPSNCKSISKWQAMLKPRAERNSQSSQRSTVRCLHVPPRPSHKLSARQDHSPGGKHNTASCECDRFPRWEFKCTLICQKSRNHSDSIHPELSRLNKARASPISISHAPLSQKPTAREDPNFEIEIHIPPSVRCRSQSEMSRNHHHPR